MPLSAPATGGGGGLSREDLVLAGRGLKAETLEAAAHSGGGSLTSGLLVGMAVGLKAGDVITGAAFRVSGAGVTLTLVKVALLDKNFNRVAVSADDKASYASVGLKQTAFTAPYTVPSSDLYYVVILATGTTPPAIALAVGSYVEPFGTINGGLRRTIQQAAQTDVPATVTPAAGLAPYWGALY